MKELNIILMQEAVRQWNGHDVTQLMAKYGTLKSMSRSLIDPSR